MEVLESHVSVSWLHWKTRTTDLPGIEVESRAIAAALMENKGIGPQALATLSATNGVIVTGAGAGPGGDALGEEEGFGDSDGLGDGDLDGAAEVLGETEALGEADGDGDTDDEVDGLGDGGGLLLGEGLTPGMPSGSTKAGRTMFTSMPLASIVTSCVSVSPVCETDTA